MSTTNGKRRNFTATFKAEIVLSLVSGQKTAAELCREYSLSPTLLGLWKDTLIGNASAAF
jgi:transposase-like protein